MEPSAEHAEVLARVRAVLLQHGATEEQIADAQREDVLDLLVADRLFVPGTRRYNEKQVAELTGMPTELARRFWRALGFPDADPEEQIFTDLDIEAIYILQAMIELGAADVDMALQLARVMGSSMARIAEAEVSPAVRLLAGGSGNSVEAADRFARMAEQLFPAMAKLLEFTWRRHVQAAVRRAMLVRGRQGDGGSHPDLAVGFADMVGFTMLSQQLSDDELAAVVSRFENVAHNITTSLGGRVVKMIGDEAMFVSESLVDAARIGLSLAEAYADDELLSDVRVALAAGPVLIQDGDYYGPVVNLASRVVNIAAPGSVLVSDYFHSALVEALSAPAAPSDAAEDEDVEVLSDEFALKALRPRQVKDLGRIQLWALFRPGSKPMTVDRRLGRRWERLSEVLQDLDELRERGERLVAGGIKVAADLSDDLPTKTAKARPPRSARTARSAKAGSAKAGSAKAGSAKAGSRRSGSGKSHRGDAEAAQVETPVHGGEGAAP